LPAGGLSYHLGTKQVGALTWDYDPPGDTVTRVVGAYDHTGKTFSWQEEYHPDHDRVSTVVTGTGGINAQGNEATAYTITTTDRLGQVTVTEIEHQRAGCSVSRSFREQGQSVWRWHTGTFSATGYAYSEWRNPERWVSYRGPGMPGSANGTLKADGSFSEGTYAGPDCTPVYDPYWDEYWSPCDEPHSTYYQSASGTPSGNVTTSYQMGNGEDFVLYGSRQDLLDGTTVVFEDADTEDWGWTVQYTRSYDGNGTGAFNAWFYDGQTDDWYPATCPITMTPTSCSVQCPSWTWDCWML
jgi:hypothetical protein